MTEFAGSAPLADDVAGPAAFPDALHADKPAMMAAAAIRCAKRFDDFIPAPNVIDG
jgi:hypothetical protein